MAGKITPIGKICDISLMRNPYKKIDILGLHSINVCNRVYLKAVSHVTQGQHLVDRVEIGKVRCLQMGSLYF